MESIAKIMSAKLLSSKTKAAIAFWNDTKNLITERMTEQNWARVNGIFDAI